MNLLVVAGSACDEVENKVECYDIAKDSWRGLPDMIRRRDYLACVSQGSTVYAICGLDRRNGREQLNSIERFDLARPDKGWSLLEFNCMAGRNSCGAVTLSST